jgi:hypothetical protein
VMARGDRMAIRARVWGRVETLKRNIFGQSVHSGNMCHVMILLYVLPRRQLSFFVTTTIDVIRSAAVTCVRSLMSWCVLP